MLEQFKKIINQRLFWLYALGIFLIVVGTLLNFWSRKLVTSSTPSSENNQQASLPTTLPSPSPENPSTKLLFGGDLMFDRNIRLAMNTHGVDHVLQLLAETFSNYDLVISNLEGPVTTSQSVSVGSAPGSTKNFIFTFDPAILPMLKKYNMQLVNLGNNHITNFGTAGVAETKSLLTQNQISFFGNTSTEQSSAERVHIQKINNHTIAFVNHNQFVPNGFATALEDQAYANQHADLSIVFTHWGNEYQPIATGVIVDQAHQLIDEGADLVIGTHPHVIQQHEDYQGKRIYYSLGNFVFDQYFSKETQEGLLVSVTISPEGEFSFSEIPISLHKNGQTQLLNK